MRASVADPAPAPSLTIVDGLPRCHHYDAFRCRSCSLIEVPRTRQLSDKEAHARSLVDSPVWLPTEAEWEHAADTLPGEAPHDPEASSFHPRAASSRTTGLRQLYGDCWQWTASAYLPYPGFHPSEGAIGEYNGKFMSNQMVLRGGSVLTPPGHTRATYRNFFPPGARWPVTGVRLADG